jgi:hypothetical protein
MHERGAQKRNVNGATRRLDLRHAQTVAWSRTGR